MFQFLKNHLRTPQSGEPGPPMDWFYLEFELFFISQLIELRPTHHFFGILALTKIYKIALSGTQKSDPQTREWRVRRSSGAQNVRKSDSFGVSVHPEEGSGDDFGDMGLARLKFGHKIL